MIFADRPAAERTMFHEAAFRAMEGLLANPLYRARSVELVDKALECAGIMVKALEAVDAVECYHETPGGAILNGHPQTMEQIKRLALFHVLQKHSGNKVDAAWELGVSLKTLYNWLAKAEEPAVDHADSA